MKVSFIPEPELEFGAGKHVDIRYGLMNLGPFDFDSQLSPKQIRLGIVGTSQTIQDFCEWLEKIRNGIEGKVSPLPNLFPRFPGYGEGTHLTADIVINPQLQRPITQNDILRLKDIENDNDRIAQAVDLFMEQITYLEEHLSPHVVVCTLPEDLIEILGATSSSQSRYDFHDLLKAKAMQIKQHTQLILPTTYQPKSQRSQPLLVNRSLQDEATRAWNLYTAIYYKAKGIPWRLVRNASLPTTCYIGVSFYRSLDQETLQTSIAQVFNELGDGIIVRGGAVKISKDDRQPHLSRDDSYSLLYNALEEYRRVHFTLPARIVIHKTSAYNDDEREGFKSAIAEQRVSIADLLSLRQSFTRLFRHGAYPPLRGTLFSLEKHRHILYTRGSVDFFQTYPGMYIPLPLEFRMDQAEQTAEFLATEILSLTKMNWNKSQFDSTDPITIEGARGVGKILKYVSKDEQPQTRYSFYM